MCPLNRNYSFVPTFEDRFAMIDNNILLETFPEFGFLTWRDMILLENEKYANGTW